MFRRTLEQYSVILVDVNESYVFKSSLLRGTGRIQKGWATGSCVTLPPRSRV